MSTADGPTHASAAATGVVVGQPVALPAAVGRARRKAARVRKPCSPKVGYFAAGHEPWFGLDASIAY